MPNTEAVITLAIKEAAQDDQRVFLFHLQLNGEVIAPTASLSSENSQAVRDLSKQYNALYEMRRAPNLVADDLRDLGEQLFNTWLASAWPAIAARVQPGTPRVLVIASDVPEILNLPWELAGCKVHRAPFAKERCAARSGQPATAAAPAAHSVYGMRAARTNATRIRARRRCHH
jgi:hypothetical protein